jgi:hypothetical protein
MTRKLSLASIVVGAALALFLAASVGAAATTAERPVGAKTLDRCLNGVYGTILDPNSILRGLTLTREQKSELRSRIYNWTKTSVGGQFTPVTEPTRNLEGLGLDPATKRTIQQRIDQRLAWWRRETSRPDGWPCQSFANPTTSIRWVKDLLVYNGFRPSTSVRLSSSRMIVIRGIQDGIEMRGRAVRSGERQIAVSYGTYVQNPSGGHALIHIGDSRRFTVRFRP